MTAPRDPRSDAPTMTLDLSRADITIHRDLRARWPRDPGMWWELDADEKSGWVYSGSNKILAKLMHVEDEPDASEIRINTLQADRT